jgi:hypothetical protein
MVMRAIPITPSNPGSMMVVELPGSFVKIRSATKIQILFFSQSTVGYSPEEETHQSEKLHSTLIVLIKKEGRRFDGMPRETAVCCVR